MPQILTNDMLLENTQSVAHFGPSMLYSELFYHNLPPFPGGVQAFDGVLGAVILESQSYITTANYIPLPPFGNHVKLHADSHYGDDDPTQWPQPYLSYHSHFVTMPHSNSLDRHDIIWWAPNITNSDCTSLWSVIVWPSIRHLLQPN